MTARYAFDHHVPLYLWVGAAAAYVTGYAIGSAVGWVYVRVRP